jgi:hypothetical protein
MVNVVMLSVALQNVEAPTKLEGEEPAQNKADSTYVLQIDEKLSFLIETFKTFVQNKFSQAIEIKELMTLEPRHSA